MLRADPTEQLPRVVCAKVCGTRWTEKSPPVDAIDGEGNSRQSDRAFFHQKRQQFFRGCQAQICSAVRRRDFFNDMGQAVHMSGDKMPSYPIAGDQGFFQINLLVRI